MARACVRYCTLSMHDDETNTVVQSGRSQRRMSDAALCLLLSLCARRRVCRPHA